MEAEGKVESFARGIDGIRGGLWERRGIGRESMWILARKD